MHHPPTYGRCLLNRYSTLVNTTVSASAVRMEVENADAGHSKQPTSTRLHNSMVQDYELTEGTRLQHDEAPPKKRSRLQPGSDDGDKPISAGSQKLESKTNRTTKAQMEKEDMEWVCALCKEAECMMQPNADEFLICDGSCQRVFHYPCAGLAQIPDRHQDWLCQECTQCRHQCSFCHEYGQDQVDVFKCRKDKCGLYFHESCLALHNVPVKMEQIIANDQDSSSKSSPNNVEANPLGNDIVPDVIPVFTCPAHQCWTCTQVDELQREREDAEAAKKDAGNKKKKKRGKNVKSIFICKSEGRIYVCHRSIAMKHLRFGRISHNYFFVLSAVYSVRWPITLHVCHLRPK